jgi:hypothetical protein
VEVQDRSGPGYAAPVALSMGALAGLNAIWNLPQLAGKANAAHDLVVYLTGGSGLAILLLSRALRDGRLTHRDVGLELSGWRPSKRILGVTMIILFGYGLYSNLQFSLPPGFVDAGAVADPSHPDPALEIVHKPSWGDLCFWFVLLSAASLAEVLVFIGVGFCMIERCLKQWGMRSWKAATLAAMFASFTFGIYHFTHAPSWWSLVCFPLMPVMLINVVCFLLTRNLYLTLGLHATFAALGMTQVQYMDPSTSPAALQEPMTLAPALAAFVIPFLALHWIEKQGCRQTVDP